MAELQKEESKKILNKIVEDLTRPLKKHTGFTPWILFLITVIATGGLAYFIQLRDGLGVTGMRDYVSWGLYISTFIFFVATALVGMLISSVLGLLQMKWITPVARIAEMIALGFAMWAGLVIVLDMGRPDRLLNVFLHARPQSPIFWDVTVITTYVTISLLLFLLPLIPDMPFLKKQMTDQPKWKQKIYEILSFGWVGTPEQYAIIKKAMRILGILIIPVALAIHTVTSWLFAFTLRVGWDSSIFGPYYVTGAFVSGGAAVILAMFILSRDFRLKDYITDIHFDKMAKLLVLLMLVYLYFNINEYFVPGYKMKKGDGHHIMSLFRERYAVLFWFVQLGGLVIPILLLLIKQMRKPLPAMIISVFVVLGAFFKRYIITVPTLENPHLPIQNVPDTFKFYYPTGIEWAIVCGAIAGALLIITILAKLFPIIPIWEIAHEKGVNQEDIDNYGQSENENKE